MAKNYFKYFWIAVFLLVLANVYLWQFLWGLDGKLKVTFFDIGQGDSIFIETSQGQQILIDGGPGERVLDKLAKAMPFWDRSLDLVVLSHPEYDHLSGLNAVLKNYKVQNILWSGIEKDSQVFKDWQKAVAEEKAKVIIGQRGQEIKAGATLFEVLSPLENLAGQFFEKDSNDTAVAVKVIFGKNSFLFSGDISQILEKKLVVLDDGCINECLAADVLKVAHHGSKTSSSAEFLQAAIPQIAVISVGKNNTYGHPTQEVLNRLQEFGIRVMRTDELGDIKMKSDGVEVVF